MYSVIMAGGVGQRFWPRSRRQKPKQLLNLTGRGSMIGLTIDRLKNLSLPEEIFIITTRSQRSAIENAVSGRVRTENIIAEPMGKNTAPCIGVAAVLLRRLGGNAPMLVLPADHIIEPTEAFEKYVRAAVSCIETHGGLLTFGIRPTRPETGYGYIQAGECLFTAGDAEVFRAEAFHEKPALEVAERFLEAGTYFWNSGMFLWKIGDILQAFAEHIPELYSVLSRIEKKIDSENIERVLESLYPQAPSISIDYGVMEKANDVVVLRADLSWNDVGSWESLRDIYGADERGNVVLGEHVFIDSSDNTVFSPERLVGMVGTENLVVVDAGDSILVCRRERTQDVRKVVEYLKEHGREDLV